MKDTHLHIRTTDEYKNKLTAICKAENRSQSQELEILIDREYKKLKLDKQDKPLA